ncbi:hypothetical protein DFH07DRAFT_16070 [Mycena maculata]|uniref:Uncharacterized protein n=1 Tax=Mycena maculata TaxID=230809 RepID=A0AAD7IKN2_9AGAR|nr:hypothetical protein DFH07DRAFT_16070 [Mycena maculata]
MSGNVAPPKATPDRTPENALPNPPVDLSCVEPSTRFWFRELHLGDKFVNFISHTVGGPDPRNRSVQIMHVARITEDELAGRIQRVLDTMADQLPGSSYAVILSDSDSPEFLFGVLITTDAERRPRVIWTEGARSRRGDSNPSSPTTEPVNIPRGMPPPDSAPDRAGILYFWKTKLEGITLVVFDDPSQTPLVFISNTAQYGEAMLRIRHAIDEVQHGAPLPPGGHIYPISIRDANGLPLFVPAEWDVLDIDAEEKKHRAPTTPPPAPPPPPPPPPLPDPGSPPSAYSDDGHGSGGSSRSSSPSRSGSEDGWEDPHPNTSVPVLGTQGPRNLNWYSPAAPSRPPRLPAHSAWSAGPLNILESLIHASVPEFPSSRRIEPFTFLSYQHTNGAHCTDPIVYPALLHGYSRVLPRKCRRFPVRYSCPRLKCTIPSIPTDEMACVPTTMQRAGAQTKHAKQHPAPPSARDLPALLRRRHHVRESQHDALGAALGPDPRAGALEGGHRGRRPRRDI